MAGVQEEVRLHVVQFIEIWKSQPDDWKSFTAEHFITDDMTKTTIYQIMKRYEQEGLVARALGSGKRGTKITHEKRSNLSVQLTTRPASRRGP